MTITTPETTTYQRPADTLPAAEEAEIRSLRLPAFFWAGCAIFALNVVIFLVVWFSPGLQVNMYGEDNGIIPVSYRPSPFAEEIRLSAAAKPKPAPRVRPVLFEEPQVSAPSEWQSSSLDDTKPLAANADLAMLPERTTLSPAAEPVTVYGAAGRRDDLSSRKEGQVFQLVVNN